ncbi:hypothetical protein SERLA73DRAFT_165231 [Serpula lacrymans var. lacrymans S7.3]|uniref:DNA mismatch repair protein S5 domain-containing protein n=2 Tax=Serpula lacrymans var. lacrymans TaxID=341189 RepID=F8PKM1_SERL3|nr:uncharacterized protein SERLADRAFT_445211 [Serpula lacrymans var. lacrymans S7.9]EGO03568.1 hypothetical protein SERLA73DRAFT_165231 [Serpula lacrymans var. lacrymans S7.3]EGO29388.1 hypothetical protein SERLADRAFT_445211 [Serpula lacrymans var. lacrymans S7.9]
MDTERRSSSPELEPQPIHRLQEAVINRIAAGEIIHRPASALKELIENSLDAGSTSIRVTVKEGGMKLLQIQDNGSGIRKADLPILAERFTTSKLSTFSDLTRLTTYGFRGEALASISHVAHLSIITKTKKDACAWKAAYSDGSLAPIKAGQTVDPKPCAGNDGTTITIEDLFYNTPTRLSALRSSSEEYSRILDVMTRYAVHNPKIAFVCKKAGSPSLDLSTPSSSDVPQAIRLLYSHSIAKELLHESISSTGNSQRDDDENDDIDDTPKSWSADVHFTNANYQAKKMVFLLFINHRLVESSRIKRSIESVYSGVLPKGASPFVYLSLEIDPRSVDVNVHPTKREVHFLDEEAIMEKIADAIQKTLAGQSQSRIFEYQVISSSRLGEPKKKISSQHKVRTSLQDRTLDSMFPIADPLILDDPLASTDHNSPSTSAVKVAEIKESAVALCSVQTLRQAVVTGKHHQLTEIIGKHTFVGFVDLPRCLSLVQHSTKLYLVNYGALAEELFYQLGLRQFANFGKLKLDPPPPLRTLVSLAVDNEEGIENSRLTKSQIVDHIVEILMRHRDMLAEYFQLHFDTEGMVVCLPLLLRDYTPNLDKLPLFLMRLGAQVRWGSESECFISFLRELAYFYSPGPLPVTPTHDSEGPSDQNEAREKSAKWQIQYILFPTMRRYLSPPKYLLDRDVVQVASLPDLYRVFERC